MYSEWNGAKFIHVKYSYLLTYLLISPVLCPASVSDLYIASSLPGQRVHVMSVSERLLTEWIALEHGVNLLHQWRHRTSLQSLLFEITLNTWTFIVAM